MNCNLHKITYPTIRILLLVKLCEAIYPKGDVTLPKVSVTCIRDDFRTDEVKFSLKEISLKQVRNKTCLAAYQSPIALQLGSRSLEDTVGLAYQIAERFYQRDVMFQKEEFLAANAVPREFTVRVTEKGWLEFGLSDRGLAAWLQFLMLQPCQALPQTQRSKNIDQVQIRRDQFTCQHSHARCGSLLHLADQAKLIQLKDVNSFDFRMSSPNPILWLTVNEQFCLTHRTEQALVWEIIATVDRLYSDSAQDTQFYFGLAFALSQAFQRFYRDCRIFGEPLQRAQARLGLVMITQKLLRSLLQEGMGVIAPAEL